MPICAFLCLLILNSGASAAGTLEEFIHDWSSGTVTRIKTECALSRRQDNFHTAVTQTSLGEKIGVQKTEMGRLFAGRQSLTLKQGLAMAQALRTKPETLLGYAEIRRYFKNPARWDDFKQRFKNQNFFSIFAEAMQPSVVVPAPPRRKPVFRLAEVSMNGIKNILLVRLKGHDRLALMFRYDPKQAKALMVLRIANVDQHFLSTPDTTLEFLRATGARKNGWPIRTLAIKNLRALNQPDEVVDLNLDLVRLNKDYSPVSLRVMAGNQTQIFEDRIKAFRNVETTSLYLREVAPRFEECGGMLIEEDIGRD